MRQVEPAAPGGTSGWAMATLLEMKMTGIKAQQTRTESAYSVVEAVIAIFLLGVLSVALFGAFSSGLALVQLARENVRATQIMMQKMEAIRLFTWSQGANTQLATTNFTDWYDPSALPSGTSGTKSRSGAGALYQGFVNITPAPSSIPGTYRPDMRTVTVTVFWTNYPGNGKKPIVRSRQMQTLAARYGMQNYVIQ